MMDPGWIVIGLFIGIIAWVIRSWRSGMRKGMEKATTRMPGERLEGSDYIGGGDP